MNRPAYLRVLSFLLLLCLLSPTAALAYGDGKKFFKEGMKHEIAEQWDKAAEEFAKAVGESPKNPEYRLHLQRSLFEASQMYMKLGRTKADEKDFAGAYTYFRKAYAFDPVNELAKSEMARMVRMQEGLVKGEGKDPKTDSHVKFTQTGYNPADDPKMPQKFEKLRDIPFPSGVNLPFIVKELAKDLELNVLFDTESRLEARTVRIELKNVTAAKALDYIFLQENLFFQKVGPRTILVASNQRRTNFQQLVLRTFYLANANPKDVKTIIQTAIPPQPGRTQTIVVEDASTNSLTIRDTAENIALFEKLIGSLDKDRAEVVMDVAIYEVSKSDLLKFGNQIGTEAQLTNLGGTTSSVVGLGGNDIFGTLGRTAANIIPSVFGAGIVLPASNLVAFQNKGNTKLLASTQIHAFNNEDSSARIGQRVPVRTAQFVTAGGTSNNGGVVSDVINYEQVGLTLKFKPIVFPNQDVQVAMDIESKDVVAGGTDNNPVFSERKIVGTARVQNNKTLLLASVAQDVESRGRSGLPLLGLIPILGRLFAAPTRDNRQVDIVIAVTPKVIRAPAILPEDEIERPTGSMALPTSGSLEAMIIQEERGEQLAMARRLPTNTAVQLPDQPSAPGYVRGAQPDAAVTAVAGENSAENAVAASTGLNVKPIDTSAKPLDIRQTSDTGFTGTEANLPGPKQTLSVEAANASTQAAVSAASAELSLPSFFKEMKRGDKVTIPVMVKSSASFRSAMLGLKFDPEKIAVRNVTFGDVFGELFAAKSVTPYINQDGKMFVSLSLENGVAPGSFGILAYVEIEALSDCKPVISLEKDGVNFRSAEGKSFAVKF
ncbi:MAG: secretin N-terminal domain-containing protein [Pyrinomonadaceae bacterium]